MALSNDVSLENQLIQTVSYWAYVNLKSRTVQTWDHERGRLVEIPNPFYPQKDDLIQETWLRLLQPKTWSLIENIWHSPDPLYGGVRGVSKFASVATTRICEDIHRKLSAGKRSPGAFAVSLQEELTLSNADGPGESRTRLD